MRMIEDVKPLVLYNNKKVLYPPVNDTDKRKGSAILLLTPNIDESIKLTKLPYIYNSNNIYTSYYIDRDVSKYISVVGNDGFEFDEDEAKTMSEAAAMTSNNSKILFDDSISILQRRHMITVFNKDVINAICRNLGLLKRPSKIVVKVHQSIQELKRSVPKYIANAYDSNLFSYTDNNEIHVLSYNEHDDEVMGAPYDIYLLNELIILLVRNANPRLNMNASRAIGCVYSGQYDLIKSKKYEYFDLGRISRGCKVINKYKNIDNGYKVKKYIKTASTLALLGKDRVNEASLSTAERNALDNQEFGIPYKRKYPLNDKDHVLAAIRMFNKCDSEDEEILAANIIKKLKKLKITDIEIGITNRFSKYYTKSIKESILLYEQYDNIISYPIDIYKDYDSFKDKFKDIYIDNNTYGNVYTDGDKVYGIYSYQMNKDGSILTSFKCFDIDSKDFITGKMLSDIINYDGIENIRIDTCDRDTIDVFCRNFDIEGDDDNFCCMKLKESTLFEGAIEDPEYHDILKICNTLTPQEFSKISFDKVYRNSPYVIKRIIHKIDNEPAGFLDVYHFPANPNIAQIVIAVNSNYRGLGISNKMVRDLLSSNLHNDYEFDNYYWTAHTDNYKSQSIATRNGFIDTNKLDKFGRKIYIRPVHKYTVSESSAILEADNKYMRKYLYNERIKNNREMMEIYEKVKIGNPIIKKTYKTIEQYKGLNLYVDLSYYHSLFLKNVNLTYQKRLDMYLELLTKLLSSIKSPYTNQTLLIPIDHKCWGVSNDTDLLDFKTNLNPFSLIVYLTRFKIEALRKLFKNKKVLFVNDKGYFTIDFNNFDLKNMTKFKTILSKLTSGTAIIEDDEDIENAGSIDNINSNKAMVAKTIDHIESISPIKINNIAPSELNATMSHLAIIDNFKMTDKAKDGVVVICIDPDGANSEDLSNIKIKVDTFITPV